MVDSPLYRASGDATRACWSGRVDGTAPEVSRWHQVVQHVDLRHPLDRDRLGNDHPAGGPEGDLALQSGELVVLHLD